MLCHTAIDDSRTTKQWRASNLSKKGGHRIRRACEAVIGDADAGTGAIRSVHDTLFEHAVRAGTTA